MEVLPLKTVKMNTYIVKYKPKQLAIFRDITKEMYAVAVSEID